jgi:hypothetical protein
MKLIGETLVLSEKENVILSKLCEGKTQIKVAEDLGKTRVYVNQVTKKLVSFGAVSISEKTKHQITYLKNEMLPIKIKILPERVSRTRRCKNCKKLMTINKYNLNQKFCSKSCRGEFQRGPRSSQWKGGSTFDPYCWKFNNDLKERVRDFFGRKCFICGEDENGITLRVHHIKYNKMACCDGGGEPLMIPLCETCHNTTTPLKNRELWEKLLYNQLMERTGGKCFLTREEVLKNDSN